MPSEIAPDIYDITVKEWQGRRDRAFLFAAEPPTLVDTGFADSTDRLFAGIDAVGVPPERVVVTHGDPDHIGGFDAVVGAYNVETWVPAQTTTDLDNEPDNRFSDGDEIGRFTAVHVPGHEPDNYVLVDETAGVAVMGDAVYGADQRGLPPGYMVLPPAFYSADLDAADRNLEKLLEYEFDTALVFHGTSIVEDAGTKLERFVNFVGKIDH